MTSKGNWDEWFGAGKKWRVCEEVTGQARMQRGVLVTFRRGLFTIAAPGAYRSPLSTNLGNRGVLLVQTDPTGAHDIPGTRAVFGEAKVREARLQGAIW